MTGRRSSDERPASTDQDQRDHASQTDRVDLDGDLNCRQLADATGLHYVTVLQYTRELHRAKAAFICRWDTDDLGRHCIKVYKIGKGRDAKRPAMTPTERTAAYKERVKQWSKATPLDEAMKATP